MTDFSKVLGVIAATLNLNATELAESLKDGEDWLSDDEISKKLGEAISGQVKAAKVAQRNRVLKETTETVAKKVKANGFNPSADDLKTTDALLDSFFEHLESSKPDATTIDPATAGKLSRDELAKLPEVQSLITAANTAMMEKYKDEVGKELQAIKSEYTTYRDSTERAERKAVLDAFVAGQLEEGNVLLQPAGASVEKPYRISIVSKEIDLNSVRVRDENGKKIPYLVDEHGDPATDPTFGKPVDLGQIVVGIGKRLYGERGPDSSKGGGNPEGQTGQNGSAKFRQEYFFKSDQELSKAMFSEPDAAKRAKMSEDFAFQQQNQKAAG